MKTILFLACLLSSLPAHALVSPTYTVFNRVQAFLQGDSCFALKDVDSPRRGEQRPLVRIDACSEKKAAAWQLLKKESADADVEFYYGGAPAEPARITGATPAEKAQALAGVVQDALAGNRYFFKSESTICPDGACFYVYSVTVELEPTVIQTFVDDLSERYGNQNLTAAEHLSGLMSDQVGSLKIGFTTKNLAAKQAR